MIHELCLNKAVFTKNKIILINSPSLGFLIFKKKIVIVCPPGEIQFMNEQFTSAYECCES